MTHDQDYYVLPPGLIDPPKFKAEISPQGMGCFLMFLILGGLFLNLVFPRMPDLTPRLTATLVNMGVPPNFVRFVILEAVAIGLSAYIYTGRKRRQIRGKLTQWMRDQIAIREEEALRITRSAKQSMEAIYGGIESLPKLLSEADLHLRSAKYEFREKAYAPFWDKIEQVAVSLGIFNARLKRIEVETISYQKLLNGRTHNFPPLAIKSEDLPNPAPQAERFRQIVRMGQKDFEFATIWEHRKTQQVILEGFRTLGEAVGNLTLTIEESFSSVARTIEYTSNMQREEQVWLRESFEEAVRRWKEQKRRSNA